MRSPPAVRCRWRRIVLSAALPLLVASSVATAGAKSPAPQKHASVVAGKSPASADTVESSGAILGVAIGMQISEARKRIDPLREPLVEPPDAKEEANKRIYWQLKETEYEWLIAWANSKGEVTRLRARLRDGREKPFSEIGDLSRAVVNTPEQAMWNVTPEKRPAFRLVAQGKEHRALTFYMFALGLEMR